MGNGEKCSVCRQATEKNRFHHCLGDTINTIVTGGANIDEYYKTINDFERNLDIAIADYQMKISYKRIEKRELRRQYQVRFIGYSSISLEEQKHVQLDQPIKPFVPKI